MGSCRHWPFGAVGQVNDARPRPQYFETGDRILIDGDGIGHIVNHRHRRVSFRFKEIGDRPGVGEKTLRMVLQDDSDAARLRLGVNARKGRTKRLHQTIIGFREQRMTAPRSDADPFGTEFGGPIDGAFVGLNGEFDNVGRCTCQIDVAAGEVEREKR